MKKKEVTPLYKTSAEMSMIYPMSRSVIDRIAVAAKAKVKIGRKVIYNVHLFDEYLNEHNEAQ